MQNAQKNWRLVINQIMVTWHKIAFGKAYICINILQICNICKIILFENFLLKEIELKIKKNTILFNWRECRKLIMHEESTISNKEFSSKLSFAILV